MKTFDEVFDGMNDGQRRAVIAKVARAQTGDDTVAEKVIRAVLADEFRIVLFERVLTLVDSNGRCIPIKDMKGEAAQANRDFHSDQPAIDYGAILARLQQFLPGLAFVAVEEFGRQAKAIVERLRSDKQARNLLNGVYLPIAIPQVDVVDYGRILDELLLPAVKRSYEEALPGRTFANHRAGTLAGQIQIVGGTRHERLLAQMKERPTVGLWFANPLQGFSIPADREQIAAFTDQSIILSGAIDTALAWVATPQVLARDWHTPGYDCSALAWGSAVYSLLFKAIDDSADFDYRRLYAYDAYSGSVLVLGQ